MAESVARAGCRCEATIPAVVLEGYACGNPACWRTAEVQGSFEAFVTEVIRRRGDAPQGPPERR